jgi:hypothetical protein
LSRLLKKHPHFAWTIHDALATLITAANETNVPAKYRHSGISELFNDFSKHIAIAYNRRLHNADPITKSVFDRTLENDWSLAFQCIYPFECRAMQEALHDGLRHFETNHFLAKELVQSGRAEWFDCIAINGNAALFRGHRFVHVDRSTLNDI